MKRLPRLRPLLAVPFAIVLVACNVTVYLDDQRLEQTIKEGIEAQTELTVTTVSCPDEQPLAQGDVFECTVDTADGLQLTITVTQTDNAGNVNWQVTGES